MTHQFFFYTFNSLRMEETLLYVSDLYHNYQLIGINLHLFTIITIITPIIVLSAGKAGKEFGKWVAAGGAFELGGQLASAGINAVKEGLDNVKDNYGESSGTSNSGSSKTDAGSSSGSSGTSNSGSSKTDAGSSSGSSGG
jgi:hypothetical protein